MTLASKTDGIVVGTLQDGTSRVYDRSYVAKMVDQVVSHYPSHYTTITIWIIHFLEYEHIVRIIVNPERIGIVINKE